MIPYIQLFQLSPSKISFEVNPEFSLMAARKPAQISQNYQIQANLTSSAVLSDYSKAVFGIIFQMTYTDNAPPNTPKCLYQSVNFCYEALFAIEPSLAPEDLTMAVFEAGVEMVVGIARGTLLQLTAGAPGGPFILSNMDVPAMFQQMGTEAEYKKTGIFEALKKTMTEKRQALQTPKG